eukprot:604639-Lingulodinium_polyedra.AAC.1
MADPQLSQVVNAFSFFLVHEDAQENRTTGPDAVAKILHDAQAKYAEGQCDLKHVAPLKVFSWLVPPHLAEEVATLREQISAAVTVELKDVQESGKPNTDKKKIEKKDAAVKAAMDFFR